MLVWHCTGGQVRTLLTLPTNLLEDPGEAAARAWQSVVAECTGAALPVGGPLHWLDLVAGNATLQHPHVQQCTQRHHVAQRGRCGAVPVPPGGRGARMKPVRLIMGPAQASPGARLLGHTGPSWQQWLALALLVASAAALASAAWQVWQLRQQAVALAEVTAALGAPAGRPARSPAAPQGGPTAALTTQQVRAWNQVIGRLNTPWPAIFDALEQSTPASVALLGIDPRPGEGSIRIQAEARTLDELLKYTAQLPATPPFGEVLLVKHETHERDPQRPVRLTVEVRPRGA
eukprot:gene3792-4852_t